VKRLRSLALQGDSIEPASATTGMRLQSHIGCELFGRLTTSVVLNDQRAAMPIEEDQGDA